jgi:hypothetical protein
LINRKNIWFQSNKKRATTPKQSELWLYATLQHDTYGKEICKIDIKKNKAVIPCPVRNCIENTVNHDFFVLFMYFVMRIIKSNEHEQIHVIQYCLLTIIG